MVAGYANHAEKSADAGSRAGIRDGTAVAEPRFSAVATPAGGCRLVLPYPPAVNHLYATVRGRRVLSRKGRQYRTSVALLCRGIPLVAGNVAVTIDVYRPRRAGDLDGVFKSAFDSLTGVAYRDDKQVVEIHARRFDDPANPRVEIYVGKSSLWAATETEAQP